MSADEDLLLHGGEYPDTFGVRAAMCDTCAFRKSSRSVRPPSVSIARLEELTELHDDFICHEPEDGLYRTCAGWNARRAT